MYSMPQTRCVIVVCILTQFGMYKLGMMVVHMCMLCFSLFFA